MWSLFDDFDVVSEVDCFNALPSRLCGCLLGDDNIEDRMRFHSLSQSRVDDAHEASCVAIWLCRNSVFSGYLDVVVEVDMVSDDVVFLKSA